MDDINENEETVYNEESREKYIESDSISVEEEGFMKGYDEAETDEEEKETEEKETGEKGENKKEEDKDEDNTNLEEE